MNTEIPNPTESPAQPHPQPRPQDSPPIDASLTTSPPDRLAQMPRQEMEHLAEDLGLDFTVFNKPELLVAAIQERRKLIASLDRDSMLDVIRWGRRPVPINASNEQLASEISRIKSMRFQGITHRGLQALGQLRGLTLEPEEPAFRIIRRLKRQEGMFARLNRKRRSLLGSIVTNIVGHDESPSDYQFLPPAPGTASAASTASAADSGVASLKDEIEEAGLFGGITSRLKKNADQYLNQKLDEIEARIDRKLDDIDRRLAEWRDREIANRIRILKITLWASVIVGIVSLIYSYVKTYWPH